MERYKKFYSLDDLDEDECNLVEEQILGSTSIFVYVSGNEERTYIVDCISGYFFKRVQPVLETGGTLAEDKN